MRAIVFPAYSAIPAFALAARKARMIERAAAPERRPSFTHDRPLSRRAIAQG
jgi:hypothetical protein